MMPSFSFIECCMCKVELKESVCVDFQSVSYYFLGKKPNRRFQKYQKKPSVIVEEGKVKNHSLK